MTSEMAIGTLKRLSSFLLIIALGASFRTATSAFAAVDPGLCPAGSNSRQLDFWLGDWSVAYPGAATPSASKVSVDLDQCLIVESWTGGKGHSGKNFFAYSSDDKAWHGMFADNEGRVHIFEGRVAAGTAEFYGPSRSADGQAVLNRIKIVRMTPAKVEQTWEKSTDQGVTWTTVFSGEYSRTDH